MSPGATGHSIEVSFSFYRVGHSSTLSLWKTSWLFGATSASFTHPFLPPSLLLGFHAWPLAPWAVWGSQLHTGCSHTHAKTLPLFLSQLFCRAPEWHFQLPLAPSAGKTHRSSEAATGGQACLALCLTRPPLSSVLGKPRTPVLESGSPAPLCLSFPSPGSSSHYPGS